MIELHGVKNHAGQSSALKLSTSMLDVFGTLWGSFTWWAYLSFFSKVVFWVGILSHAFPDMCNLVSVRLAVPERFQVMVQ